MGYPMTYSRLVRRNDLAGDGYNAPYSAQGDMVAALKSLIQGDLRRLESDQRDPHHLAMYAAKTGLTTDQVRAVLDLFFDADQLYYPPTP